MGAYEKLKLMLGVGDEEKDLLELLLDEAKAYILSYCNIAELPDSLSGTQVKIAVKYYNRRGQEGSTSYSEGAKSQSFDNILTNDIRIELNTFRKVVF